MFTKIRMKEEKGFTLIELLIVVAIIGILAAIAIPQFGAYRKRGYNAAANSDLRTIRTTEEAMQADFQDYAASGSSTTTAGTAGAAIAAGAEFYLIGGKTTSVNQKVSLSSNVKAIVYTITNTAGSARTDFAAITGNTAGDTYYLTSNGTVTGSSNLYRRTSTTISADVLSTTVPAAVNLTTAGAAAVPTESATAWVKM